MLHILNFTFLIYLVLGSFLNRIVQYKCARQQKLPRRDAIGYKQTKTHLKQCSCSG